MRVAHKLVICLVCLCGFGLVVASAQTSQQPSGCAAQSCDYLPLIVVPLPNTPTPTSTDIPTPTATNTATATLTATDVPGSVFVKSSTGYNKTNAYYVYGEVYNGLNAPIYSVTVTASYYGASGGLLGTRQNTLLIGETNPGEVNGFWISYVFPPVPVASHEIEITYSTVPDENYEYYAIISQSSRVESYGVEVYGEVRNNFSETLYWPGLTVTFYDTSGRVVFVEDGYPSTISSDHMEPNTTYEYLIMTFEDTIDFSSFVVKGQGYLATPTPTSTVKPTPTGTILPTPTRLPSSYSGCSEDPNSAAAPNYPVDIVTVVKDSSPERVVLLNTSDYPIDLTGWTMCSITGNQVHSGISGALAAGEQKSFAYTGSGFIWNNTTDDDGALYDNNGSLISYWND